MTTRLTKKYKPSSSQIEECIISIVSGNDDAMQQLYDLIASSVYAYALSILKNTYDAQDVLHDTLIKVYESAHLYSPQGKPMAWILTIAKNLCFTKFRQRSRICDITDEAIEAQFADNVQMSVEDKILVTKCLSKLADDERTIVVLHAMTGLKHREIAKLMQMPLATVLSKYNRALKKLKTIIKGELQ